MPKLPRKLKGWRLKRFYAYLIYAMTLLVVVVPLLCWLHAPDPHQAFGSVRAAVASPLDNSLDYIAVLSSFYQTVISILALALGVLSVVAFVTIRHTSRVAAEDMAADAARRVIEDSRTIQQDIDDRIEESFSKSSVARIDALEGQIKLLTQAIQNMSNPNPESIPETQVVAKGGNEDGSSKS